MIFMKHSIIIGLFPMGFFVLLFSQCSNPGNKENSEEARTISAEGYFPGADSLNLFYTIQGQGPDTLVMIHGGPGMDAGYMINDFEKLAESHVLLYYDQRGGGKSDLPDTSSVQELLSIDRHVADLEALRKYFGFSKMNLLAHSFGPAIAVNYAIDFSDQVKKMVFIGPIPPYRGDFLKRYDNDLSSRLHEEELKKMDSLAQEMIRGKDPVGACMAYWNIALKPRVSSELPLSVVKGKCCTAPAEGIRYGYQYTGEITFASLGDWDYRNKITKLMMPVLIIHGVEESIPMDMVEEWIKYLPNAKLEKIERAAHFPYAERPEVVGRILESFLGESI